jgi:tripartite-type tricarboxylate transporter receptor subunit TctC
LDQQTDQQGVTFMTTMDSVLRRSFVAATVAAIACTGAAAQSVEEFYSGRQITMVISAAPGGGYDAAARIIAQHMPKYIPGNPTIVTKNMPGAGGVRAISYLYSEAPKDGATIGATHRDPIVLPLLEGAKFQGRFDPRDFVWLGTPSQDVGMIAASTRSGVKSLEDTKKRQMIVGASGDNQGSANVPKVLNALVGTNFKVVTGYTGSGDTNMALLRGEADLRVATGWTGPNAQAGDELVKSGDFIYLAQLGLRGNPAYKDVPTIIDLIDDKENREIMKLILLSQSFGRPYLAPPGIPADRAAALQAAFKKTMTDPDFIADAEKNRLELDPTYGEELKKLLNDAYALPPALLKRAQDLYAGSLD